MRVLLFRVFFVIPFYSSFKGRLRVGGEKILCSLRVILYMGSPQIFNFWGERKQQSPNDASVIHCDLLAERESSAQTILRSSFAASALADAFFVYHSRISCGCFFPKKALLLRFPFPCTYPIPLGLKTKEEPKTNQGTPKERPTTQKCFLLRLATSKKSLLR